MSRTRSKEDLMQSTSFENPPTTMIIDQSDFMAYIARHRQVMLLREIESKFGQSNYLNKKNAQSQLKAKLPGEGSGHSLAVVKRSRPIPAVGHYDNIAD